MSYAITALLAAKWSKEEQISPEIAWEQAVKIEFPISESLQEKGCPRNTFLGLCKEGFIKGIKIGDYTQSDLNRSYGIAAVQILKTETEKAISASSLWDAVLKALGADSNKKHNYQMNVVLALWHEGFINI